MPFPADWSPAVRDYLTSNYDEPKALEQLDGGQSGSAVWRVAFGALTLIIKFSRFGRESYFYREIGPQLVGQGLHLPRVLQTGATPAQHWLILEYLPQMLPRSRWIADPAVMEQLARLHTTWLTPAPDPTALFRPQWTTQMNAEALAGFSPVGKATLQPWLAELQAKWQELFAPVGPISGDPNPGNWGLRANGEVVLFDWERFGYGHPALDLAITLPAFAPPPVYQQVAATYLSYAQTTGPASIEKLAEQIAVAKIWNVVEYLSMHNRGEVQANLDPAVLVNRLENWLVERYKAFKPD